MRWIVHAAYMGERTGVYRILVGKSEEKDHWGDPGAEWSIILRWISRKWGMELELY
jgi:hypothetical protein